MVHLATCIALLSLIALWSLVPIPHLLHLLTLHWGVWSIPLGTGICIMPILSTLEANGTSWGAGPHWGANWGRRAWSLLHWALKLLAGALELLSRMLKLLLLLPNTPTRASRTKWCPLRWSKAGASVTARLSRSGGLPLQLSQLSALMLQTNGLI